MASSWWKITSLLLPGQIPHTLSWFPCSNFHSCLYERRCFLGSFRKSLQLVSSCVGDLLDQMFKASVCYVLTRNAFFTSFCIWRPFSQQAWLDLFDNFLSSWYLGRRKAALESHTGHTSKPAQPTSSHPSPDVLCHKKWEVDETIRQLLNTKMCTFPVPFSF